MSKGVLGNSCQREGTSGLEMVLGRLDGFRCHAFALGESFFAIDILAHYGLEHFSVLIGQDSQQRLG
jgi:hypothetical protein